MKIMISVETRDKVIGFAARELARCLRAATGRPCAIGEKSAGALFRLSLIATSPCKWPLGAKGADVAGDGRADTIVIHPEGAGYFIGGSNPRSVLFAVYRYLREMGFRWIRPGARGEIIPRLNSPLKPGLRIREQASYLYRTVCIEGACSERHVLDLIAWMARQGMNGYFIQLEYGSFFWRQWYAHDRNPHMEGVRFKPEDARPIVKHVIAALQLRGMRFERFGHGWTCAMLGVETEGWVGGDLDKLPAAKRKIMAMTKGKRQFCNNLPLVTNLCYSNPAVKRAMVEMIAQYARKHPEISALHFWLADGANNNCECPRCRNTRVADFYVAYLNAIDARLTALGLKTRIVFLIYVDLLWPPVKNRIKNPDRFILMFAPITRKYTRSFAKSIGKSVRTMPYRVNKLTMPRDEAQCLAYLKAWQAQFKGEGFDFDYHLLWACYHDLAQFNLARVLHDDIQALEKIGLNGFNSCQVQRMSFPHNLLLDVMARTLWNKRASFQGIVRETFGDAFGPDGMKVARFMEKMSDLGAPWFEPVYRDGFAWKRIRAGQKNLPRMRRLVDGFRPIVARNLKRTQGAVRWSWRYAGYYLEIMDTLIPAYDAYLRRSFQMRNRFAKVFDFMWRLEPVLHPALDVHMAQNMIRGRMEEADQAGCDPNA